MIQLTRKGAVLSGSPAELDHLREQFDREHWIRLPSLIEPALLQFVLGRIEQGQFQPFRHGDDIAVEDVLEDAITVNLLNFLPNDPRFYQFVRQITGCAPIGCFRGRVYRLDPHAGHFDSWHDDLSDGRLVTMSVNLSPTAYAGGILQIRTRGSDGVLADVANTGLGDAILFRISAELEHRVGAIEGNIPKTAFAGWFKSQPDLYARLAELRRGHTHTEQWDSPASADAPHPESR